MAIIEDFQHKNMSPIEAQKHLIRLLQNAHAGERAAANAYYGHTNSFFMRDLQEKKEIFSIYQEELHHRERLNQMLASLDAKPRPRCVNSECTL